MAAIISGNSLGVSLTSLSTLGRQASSGSASTGRNGEQAFVNAATGNLVLQDADEALKMLGNDAVALRTYNSRGSLTDDNADNWAVGADLQCAVLNGNTVVRTARDGAQSLYLFDAVSNRYVSTDGAGAFDSFTLTTYKGEQALLWTDGDTSATEIYGVPNGKLLRSSDADGNAMLYDYSVDGLLQAITREGAGVSAPAEQLRFQYSGRNLVGVDTLTIDAGNARTTQRVRYTYDALNRLETVSVDLTPADNSIADGKVYLTRYGYDGTSTRITSVDQTDGTHLGITYVQTTPGEFRVETLTDALGHVTRYAYDLAQRSTTVADPLGSVWSFVYDAQGQLLKSIAPATGAVGAPQAVTQFVYDASGNLTSTIDALGNTVVMHYDTNGNQIDQANSAGNTVTRTFNARNQVVTETVSPTQNLFGVPLTSFNIYDPSGAGHLLYSVSAEGRVTQNIFNAAGQTTSTIHYTQSKFDFSILAAGAVPAKTDVDAWAARQDKRLTTRTDFAYDLRGQLQKSTTWESLDALGNGVVDGKEQVSAYGFDAAGRLLFTASGNSIGNNYTYDGLGRVLTSTNARRETTLTNYNDAGNSTSITTAAGLTTVSTFDSAGRLVTQSQSGAGSAASLVTSNVYDANDRVRETIDPTGQRRWFFHDEAGRKTGELDGTGSLTEWVFNAAGQVERTVQYASKVSQAMLDALTANPLAATLAPGMLSNSMNGWTMQVDGATTGFDSAINLSPDWALADEPTLWLRQTGTANTSAVLAGPTVSVTAGQTYHVSAYTGVHRATASIELAFFDAAGNKIATVMPSGGAASSPGQVLGGRNLQGYLDLAGNVVAPAGVVSARIQVRKAPTLAGQADSYLFVAHAALSVASASPVANNVADVRPVNITTGASLLSGALNVALSNWKFSFPPTTPNFYSGTNLNDTWTLTGEPTLWFAQAGTDPITTYVSAPPVDVQAGKSYHLSAYTGAHRTNVGLEVIFFDQSGNALPAANLVGDLNNSYRTYGGSTLPGYLQLQGDVVAPKGAVTAVMRIRKDPTFTGETTSYAFIAKPTFSETSTDLISRNVYDAAGRLSRTIDATGAVVGYKYDGAGRLLDTVYYFNRLTDPAAAPVADPVNDRHSHNFYDGDGLLLGHSDGEGSLTEYFYDAAARSVGSKRYAAWVDANVAWQSALKSVRVLASGDAAHDITTTQVRNAAGQVVAEVDGENYLTTFEYSATGKLLLSRRYGNPVTQAVKPGVTSVLDVPALIPAVPGEIQTTSYEYDDLDRLKAQTNAEGTRTEYAYNIAGQVQSTTVAASTNEARTTQARFDAFGRCIAELSAQAATLIPANATQAQIDAVWASNATVYTYDGASRRTSVTDANHNTTWFYYDAAGRVTHTINASGEVSETRYNALGEAITQVQYGNRLNFASFVPQGGVVNAALTNALTNALATLANYTLDARTDSTYNAQGKLASQVSAEGASRSYEYNAFGEQTALNELISINANSGVNPRIERRDVTTYDRRGAVRTVTQDVNGLKLAQTYDYDALGRLTTTSDPLYRAGDHGYDRLGHLTFVKNADGTTSSTSYDAFSRVLTVTNSLKQATTYTYDTANRSVTMKTPEGVTVTTSHTRHRQQLSVTDGNGVVTSYEYDRNGALTKSTNPLAVTVQEYDAGGRLKHTTLTGVGNTWNTQEVVLEYDAANRVLTRTQGSGAAKLTTSTTYDALGRAVTVSDARNTTRYGFDRDGRLTRQTVDPGGLDLNTFISYDNAGNKLSVTDPAGTRTETTYDAVGRCTKEVSDVSVGTHVGLNLTRRFEYNANGQVTASYDAMNQVSRNIYNNVGQLAYAIDAAGGVTGYGYDTENRITSVARYPVQYDISKVTSLTLAKDFGAAIEAQMVSTGAGQQKLVEYRAYDKDGRLARTRNAHNDFVTYKYDGNGNVVERRAYAQPITDALWANGTPPSDPADQRERTVYDALGRAQFQIDGAGGVTELAYDAAGHVVASKRYANAVMLGDAAQLAASDITKALQPDAGRDAVQRSWYDSVGREVWTARADGTTVLRNFDGAGDLVNTHEYAMRLAVNADVSTLVASGADRNTGFTYDKAHRLLTSTDTAGVVTRTTYDNNGNVTRRVVTPPAGALGDLSPRAEIMTYDAANRLVMHVGADGAVTETVYDGLGRASSTIAYAKGIAPAEVATLPSALAIAPVTSEIRARVNATDPANRVTTINIQIGFGNHVTTVTDAEKNVSVTRLDGLDRTIHSEVRAAGSSTVINPIDTSYDFVGHVVATTDANLTTERHVYDPVGNLVSFTNRNGATWTYTYDGAGHQLSETSPYVHCVSLPAGDGAINAGMVAYADGTIITKMAYDALGRLISRTEAAGRTEERTTSYGYDADGHQVLVTYPAFGVYTPESATALAANGETGTATRSETTRTPVARTVYDTLGNAVANLDVAGAVSYKSYDNMGQVRYDVDALGYVTGYERDAWGNVVRLTRYAQAIALPSGDPASGAVLSTSDIGAALSATSVDHSADRVVTTDYDAANRAVAVRTPSVYTVDTSTAGSASTGYAQRITQTEYNVFGDVTLVVDGYGRADSRSLFTEDFYDRLGRKTSSIDAGGYVTQWQYDALGHERERIERAQVLAGWVVGDKNNETLIPPFGKVAGNDRWTSTDYDNLGRKKTETRHGTSVWDAASNATVMKDVSTTYQYDAVGNLLVTTEGVTATDEGVRTESRFDALGRVWTVIAAPVPSSANGSSSTPYTVFDRDAYGNVVRKYEGFRVPTAPGEDLFKPLSSIVNPGYIMKGGDHLFSSDGRFDLHLDADGVLRETDRVGNKLMWQAGPPNSGATQFSFAANGDLVLSGPGGVVWSAGTAGKGGTSLALQIDGNLVIYDSTKSPWQAIWCTAWIAPVPLETPSNFYNRYTLTQYDRAGHVLRVQDAAGNDKFSSVDVFGHVVKTWQTFTDDAGAKHTQYEVTQYDALGRKTAVLTPASISRQVGLGGVSFVSSTWATWYNVLTSNKTILLSGQNTINLNVAQLVRSDLGSVRVTVNYSTLDTNALIPASTTPFVSQPNYIGTSSISQKQSVTVSATQAMSGVAFSWFDNLVAVGGIGGLSHVLVEQQDAAGNWITRYDGAASAGALGGGTLLQDEAGSVAHVWSYNAFGEATQENQAGLVSTTAYDNAGNAWAKWDAQGVMHGALYDVLGRQTVQIERSSAATVALSQAGVPTAAVLDGLNDTVKTINTYDALGHVVRQAMPVQTVSDTMAATAVQLTAGIQSISGTTPVAMGIPVQQASTTVKLNCTGLDKLGAGDVKVDFTLVTGSSSTLVSQVKSAAELQNGYTYSTTAYSSQTATLGQVTLSKRDQLGKWVPIAQTSGPGTTVTNYVDVDVSAESILGADYALAPTTQVDVQWKPAGAPDSGYLPLNAVGLFDNVKRFSPAAVTANSLDLRVIVTRPGQTPLVTYTSTVQLVAPPLTATAVNVSFGQVAGSANTLAWAPIANQQATLRVRPSGTSAWTAYALTVPATGLVGVDLSSLAAGNYDYEVLFTPTGSAAPTSHATGSFAITAAVPSVWVPPVNLPNVSVSVSGSSLQWASVASAPNGVLQVRLAGTATWQTLPVASSAGVQSADTLSLAAGTYDYALQLKDAAGNALAQATGSVNVAATPPATVSTVQVPVSQSTTITPADPAGYVNSTAFSGYRGTLQYGAPIVASTDANGQPILAAGYVWATVGTDSIGQPIVGVVAVPATVVVREAFSSATPPTKELVKQVAAAPTYSAAQRRAAILLGEPLDPYLYDAAGNILYDFTYQINPVDPKPYVVGGSGGRNYTSPVFVGADANGQPILGQGYVWQNGIVGGTVLAQPYVVVTQVLQSQTIVTPGVRPAPTLAGSTTPPYAPGYNTAAIAATYKATANANPGTVALSQSITTVGTYATLAAANLPGQNRPVIVATYDRWGNELTQSDVRSTAWVTKFEYDRDNHLVRQTSVDANGQLSAASAVTVQGYDALGRLAASMDARSNTTKWTYDGQGHVLAEQHSDGGVVRYGYNAFGDRTSIADAMNHVTSLQVDALGRTVQVTQAGEHVWGINAAGLPQDMGVQGRSQSTRYDELGRVVRSEGYDGEVTYNCWDAAGNQVATTLVAAPDPTAAPAAESARTHRMSLAVFDNQHHQTASRDANGNWMRWGYVNGRLDSHTDLGGNVTRYSYDQAGRVSTASTVAAVGQVTIAGTDASVSTLTYSYDQAGQTVGIVNDMTMTGGSHRVQTSQYAYDLAGHRVLERVRLNGELLQDNHLAYDTLGRLAVAADTRVSVFTEYDAAGNRSHVRTSVFKGTAADQAERYFVYDSMNRQVVVDATSASDWRSSSGATPYGINIALVGNDQASEQAYLGVNGHRITYDLHGNRTSDLAWGKLLHQQTYWGVVTPTVTDGYARTQYRYDALDRLSSAVLEAQQDNWVFNVTGGTVTGGSYVYTGVNNGLLLDLRRYDAGGHAEQSGAATAGELATLSATSYGLSGTLTNPSLDVLKLRYGTNSTGTVVSGLGTSRSLTHYDGFGQMLDQHSYSAAGVIQEQTSLVTDAAGNVLANHTVQYDDKGAQSLDQTVTSTLAWQDRAIEAGQSINGNWVQTGKTTNGSVTQRFDAAGNLLSVRDTTQAGNNRDIVNDSAGQALRVVQGDAVAGASNPSLLHTQFQFIVNGDVLGRTGEALDTKQPKDANGVPQFAPVQDLSFGFRAIDANTVSGASSLTVQAGQTLQGIAQQAYGDAGLWYLIAEANGLAGNSDLKVGQTLALPSNVGTAHNAAGTVRPYDPSRVIGDTSPNLPKPQGGGGCGGLGMLIVVVVAVVVAYVTQQYVLAEKMVESAAAAGAIGAAAGSVASQLVGMAIGVQDRFSWKQVGLAAVGGAVSGALSDAAKTATALQNVALKAALSNAITQGIGVATGLQKKFDWRGVAASAAGAFAGDQMKGLENNESLQRVFGDASNLAAATIRGFVAGTTTALARGGRVAVQQIATDAFGNALGESIAGAMLPQQAQPLRLLPSNPLNLDNMTFSDLSESPSPSPSPTGNFAADVAARQRANPYASTDGAFYGATFGATFGAAQVQTGAGGEATRMITGRDGINNLGDGFARQFGRAATPEEAVKLANYNGLSSAHDVSNNRELYVPKSLSDLNAVGASGLQVGEYQTRAALIELTRMQARAADAVAQQVVGNYVDASMQMDIGGSYRSEASTSPYTGPSWAGVYDETGVFSMEGSGPIYDTVSANIARPIVATHESMQEFKGSVLKQLEYEGKIRLEQGAESEMQWSAAKYVAIDMMWPGSPGEVATGVGGGYLAGKVLGLAGTSLARVAGEGSFWNADLGEFAGTQMENALVKTANVFRPSRFASDMSFEQTEALKNLTLTAYEQLKLAGNTPNSLGPAFTVAQDMVTGEVRFGLNSRAGRVPENIVDALDNRIVNMPPEIRDGYVRSAKAGTHAEIYAVNDLMLARQGATLSEIAVSTIETGNPAWARGMYKPACPHCEYILNGVHYVK